MSNETPPDRTNQDAETAYRDPPPVDDQAQEKTGSGGKWGAGAAVGGAALLKGGGWKFFLLFKGLTMGKFLLSSASWFTMVWWEAMRYGWGWAAGFVAIFASISLGSVWATNKSGLKANWPIFIPFFGSVTTREEGHIPPATEAFIAIMGPFVAAILSLGFAGYGLLFHSRMALSIAFSGFFVTMLQLLPIVPLKGGYIARLFSPRAWIIGLVALFGLFLLTHSIVLLFIAIVGTVRMFRKPDDEYLAPTDEERLAWAARYFCLLSFLGAAMFFTQRLLAASN